MNAAMTKHHKKKRTAIIMPQWLCNDKASYFLAKTRERCSLYRTNGGDFLLMMANEK
jgi:hypothetical protein